MLLYESLSIIERRMRYGITMNEENEGIWEDMTIGYFSIPSLDPTECREVSNENFSENGLSLAPRVEPCAFQITASQTHYRCSGVESIKICMDWNTQQCQHAHFTLTHIQTHTHTHRSQAELQKD